MKYIKYLFFLFILITIQQSAPAQNPVKTFTLSGGYTSNKSMHALLAYEFSKNGYNRWGLQGETFFYYEDDKHVKNIYSLGAFYKRQFTASKNFSANWYIGAAAGTDNAEFFWYPFGGLEQVFYPNNMIQLFIGQRVVYVFNINKNWQPSVNAGVKISF